MYLQLLWCQQVVVQATVVRCSLRARIWPDFHLVDAWSLQLLWCQQVAVQATVVHCSLGARIWPDFRLVDKYETHPPGLVFWLPSPNDILQ
jgi:hypothetical protein